MRKTQNLNSCSYRWYLAVVALVAAGLASAHLTVWADSGPADVDIEVRAGFGGLQISRLGGWVPFRIVVTNQGSPIAGRLVVFADASPNHQSREFSEEVQLPTGSKKQYEIDAYLSSAQVDPVVRLIQHSSSGDRVVTETPIKVEQEAGVPGDQVEIAVVDVDETALSNINAMPLDVNHVPFTPQPATGAGATPSIPALGYNLASGGNQGSGPARYSMYGPRMLKAKPVVIGPSDLPRGFGSYDSLDAVILGGAPLSQLDPDQGKALRLWVASGGLLIVTGGSDFPSLRTSGLDVLMPADVLGTETGTAIAELTSLYGSFEGADPILTTRARPRPGTKLLVGTMDHPLIAERPFGRGTVRFIAIDPKQNPFRAWRGSANLWQDVLLPAAQFRQRRFSLANFNGQVSSTLYDMAKVKPPAAVNLLLFLLAYLLVVGPLNYFGLRWARKLDLAWLTIPVVVVVFTGFSIVAAQTSRGSDLVCASVSGVEIYQQEGLVRTTSDLLLVFPSKDTHELAFDSGAFVNDASVVAAGDPITTNYHPNSTSLAIPADKWVPISFRVRQVIEGQPAVISVVGADSATVGGYVRIKNLSDLPIARAVVLTRAGITGLCDLGPGEEQKCELQAPVAQTFSAWYAGQLASDPANAQVLSYLAPSFQYGAGAAIAGDVLSNTAIPNLVAQLNRPILVGFGEAEEPRFGYTGASKHIGRQMFIVHL